MNRASVRSLLRPPFNVILLLCLDCSFVCPRPPLGGQSSLDRDKSHRDACIYGREMSPAASAIVLIAGHRIVTIRMAPRANAFDRVRLVHSRALPGADPTGSVATVNANMPSGLRPSRFPHCLLRTQPQVAVLPEDFRGPSEGRRQDGGGTMFRRTAAIWRLIDARIARHRRLE